jgi:nucleotidyltransferase substrate binding protein (TIGR01987 family)
MVDETIERDVHNLGEALVRLGGALAEPESASRCCEDTAQAFEYAMGVFWVVARKALATKGIEARLPRQAVSAACEHGWIEDPDLWLDMLKDEYELSASYNTLTTRRLYPRIRQYHPELCRAHALIVAQIHND